MREAAHGGIAHLFNSHVETGVRSVVILNAAYPMSFDVLQLTWFDHLVVHTGGLGGPASLHPDLPSSGGELLVRRTLVAGGIALMRRYWLLEEVVSSSGIEYKAGGEALGFVELMRSKYSLDLIERAQWMAENICSKSKDELSRLVDRQIGRWSLEFQVDSWQGGVR